MQSIPELNVKVCKVKWVKYLYLQRKAYPPSLLLLSPENSGACHRDCVKMHPGVPTTASCLAQPQALARTGVEIQSVNKIKIFVNLDLWGTALQD